MNDLNRIRWNSGLVGWAITLVALTCSAYGEPTQFIAANLAGQADGWGETPQNGIPCMQTYGPNNFLLFDVIVPDPGAVCKISLGLVKVTNGGCLKVFIDDELQTEIDTYATGNHRTSIPVCEMLIAPGNHSLKIKSGGQ